MNDFEYEEPSLRQLNQKIIAQNVECKKIIDEMHAVENFLSDFGVLSLDRDFVLCGKRSFSRQTISTSSVLTAGSIISCCESGCIADAYTLMRKYRDDLFFYLYIVVYNAYNKLDNESPTVAQMEKNIENWLNNGLKDLFIGTVLKAIGQSQHVKDAVQKYNLQSYFDDLGDKLNNYVHSNGVSFYNRNVDAYQGKALQKQLQSLLTDMRSITITFLFLLTLCAPLSIMSTDYADYLDCNMTPPDGSQYWVAPFVTAFFKRNLDLIDESCLKYLQDNTLMEFE